MAFRTDRTRGDLLYLFDMNRGVEVLRLKKGATRSRRMKAVTRAEREARPARRQAGRRARDRSVSGDGGVELRLPAVHLTA